MFKFNPAPSLSLSVTLREPLDGGKHRESAITVRYRLLDVDQYQERLAASRAGNMTDLEILEADIESIEGVRDADGVAQPYSVDLLRQMARWYWIRDALVQGWTTAQTGVGAARAKN